VCEAARGAQRGWRGRRERARQHGRATWLAQALKAQWRGATQPGRWPSGTVWPSPEEGGLMAQASWGIKEIFVESFLCTEQSRKPSRIHLGFCLFVRDFLRDFSEVLCTYNLDD
jgi:hypothetical protein